jgi:hypothetical protein
MEAAPSASPPTPRYFTLTGAAQSVPTIRGLAGDWVYPCADPAEICEHLATVGCSTWRLSNCRDTIGALGEDVCLKLYEAKTTTDVRRFGVACAGPSR